MPKYYIAEVTVVKKYEVRVSSSNEKEASEKAKKKIMGQGDLKEISSHVGNVDLKFDGESNFEIGQKIRHHIFGVGVIRDLIRTTNCNNERGETATIEFEDREEKRIALSFIDQKVEVIE